jgi:hypothetical protein
MLHRGIGKTGTQSQKSERRKAMRFIAQKKAGPILAPPYSFFIKYELFLRMPGRHPFPKSNG